MYNNLHKFVNCSLASETGYNKCLVQLTDEQANKVLKYFVECINAPKKGILAIVEDLDVREVEKKSDGTKFTTIDVYLRGYDGKAYKKGMSPDFIRRYNSQLGCTLEDLLGATVLITVKDKYRNAGLFAPIAYSYADGEEICEDIEHFTIEEFVDDTREDVLKKLKALGL